MCEKRECEVEESAKVRDREARVVDDAVEATFPGWGAKRRRQTTRKMSRKRRNPAGTGGRG